MKIDPNLIIGAVTGNNPAEKQTGKPGVFEDMLSNLEGCAAKETTAPANIPPMDTLCPQKVNALTMSEQALDMMDSYAKALVDPAMTLKSLAPMVNELDAMRTKLIEAGSFISEDDPLKGIISDMSSTLYGEVLRFRRGDLTG